MLSSILLAMLFSGPASAFDRQGEKEARSVVQISVFSRRPNHAQPWQMSPEESAAGSGCVIAGERILTNAHVVSGQVYLQVRKAGDPRKYAARVEFTAHDSELAVLKVNDPSFYKGTEPLALGGLPRQRDRVFAYGFPVGGEDLSVTEGIVSRIEVTDYAHSGRGLLTIQTDAAINPGNSGGPALLEGKLIGITFQYD
ncbi:MAG: serine protease, partial [Elusimicrobiota bacterium]